MTHPSEHDLALFAGGDLRLLDRWRTSHHVKSCERCSIRVDEFRAASAALSESVDEIPRGVRWERLAAEMTGNIRVGLAAGECVAQPAPKLDKWLGWRAAAVMSVLSLIVVAALWSQAARLRTQPQAHELPAGEGVVIQYTPSGLEVKENGNALTLMHPRRGQRTISTSAPGILRVRYVDGDSGQVTINNVYAE